MKFASFILPIDRLIVCTSHRQHEMCSIFFESVSFRYSLLYSLPALFGLITGTQDNNGNRYVG